MLKKSLGLFLAGVLLLADGIAVATHVSVPPISDGGELAYVRNYAPDAVEAAGNGETVSATYVAWKFDPRPNNDLALAYTSRGRMADNQVWHQIWLPQGALGSEVEFRAVEQWERGMIVASSDAGCLGLLNGVNAGLGYVASQDTTLKFKTTGHYDVVQTDDDRVELLRDGHVMALETQGDAGLEVTGVNIWVNLSEGAQVRSWIDGGAFPATTAVMHSEFDHLADDCLAEPEAAEPKPDKKAKADDEDDDEDDEDEEDKESEDEPKHPEDGY